MKCPVMTKNLFRAPWIFWEPLPRGNAEKKINLSGEKLVSYIGLQWQVSYNHLRCF